jgi:hypothetical protein
MSILGSTLQPGFTQFYDYDEPGLPAGTYQISVTQALPNAVTNQFSRTVTQTFVAQGPQFSLDASEIHAQFPAGNANGDFSQVLPNIMLENPKLPWERALTSNSSGPWMALLVFSANEVDINPETNSPIITSSVADFLAPVAGVVKPGIAPSSVSPALLASSMNSILISTEVFQAVTPRLVELSSLAHVREVNPEHQAVGDLGTDGWYSVLLANRFPDSSNSDDAAGAENFVHLVSFEGLSDYLVDGPAWPTGCRAVQLASLASWRFVSTVQAGQTFADLAENLITSVGPDPTQLLLKIPITSDGSTAATRINEGYTALSYHTLPGPDTFAWYRGPFSPVPPQPLPSSIAFYQHPSQAQIYDQANGVFDLSYASAWTIGRLAALSDPDFIDSMQQARSRVLSTSRRLLERSRMPHLAGLSLEELAAPGATRKHLGRTLSAGMGAALTAAFEQPQEANLTGISPRREKRRTNYLLAGEEAPKNPASELRWFLNNERVASFLTAQVADDLDPLAGWLAKLVLLYNIPFNHLVPDQRMLPTESARFFYVDQDWLTVLANAAMTIGVHGTRDMQVNKLVAPELWRQAKLKVPTVRRKLLRKQTVPSDPLPPMPAAGLLLRSELVSGWPGLQVIGTVAGTTVNALRIDRLAPNVLIVLWDAVPDTVTISQPQQGLAFGVENGTIALRSLTAANLGQQTGSVFPTTGNISQFYRSPTGNVGQQVLQLVPATPGAPDYLIPGLQQALSQNQLLSPAQFAIEMVNAPQQIEFASPMASE